MVDGAQLDEAALIQQAIERLVARQHSSDESVENDAAIYHLREALRALSLRDSRRSRPSSVT